MRNLLLGLVFVLSLSIVASPNVVLGDTATDEFDACIAEAVERAEERAANDEGSVYTRFVSFNMDVAICTADYINPLT